MFDNWRVSVSVVVIVCPLGMVSCFGLCCIFAGQIIFIDGHLELVLDTLYNYFLCFKQLIFVSCVGLAISCGIR